LDSKGTELCSTLYSYNILKKKVFTEKTVFFFFYYGGHASVYVWTMSGFSKILQVQWTPRIPSYITLTYAANKILLEEVMEKKTWTLWVVKC